MPALIVEWLARGITDEHRTWARSRCFDATLELHFEEFRDYMSQSRNWKRYTDLDAAFRSCVRDDWGDIRMQAERKARIASKEPGGADPPKPRVCRYCARPATGAVGGIPFCGVDDHAAKAMDRVPAPEGILA